MLFLGQDDNFLGVYLLVLFLRSGFFAYFLLKRMGLGTQMNNGANVRSGKFQERG